MDTPICVFDAQTFIDHIHQVKAWIYGGHLRLVVPASTSEIVEQLYKISIEPKPTVQEPSRTKPAGKPARKVHPAFDINPTVAREFLARIQKGKDGDQYVKDRPHYEEYEKWDALRFQTSKEEYTPWKDIPVEEEKAKVNNDRPLSWAELAKKKLANQANGNADTQALKGPAKPKLVSKASGNDTSPWKVQNNAPKVSATEVPGSLRPLMSCALWRLHESIERNDCNQVFLLSDDEQIRIVAKTLNIAVQSTMELGQKIAASAKVIDLNVEGMLEDEGLAKAKGDAKVVLLGEAIKNEPSENVVLVPSGEGGLLAQEDHSAAKGSLNGKGGSVCPEDSILQTDMSRTRAGLDHSAATLGADGVLGKSSGNDVAQTALDPKDLVKSILDASLIQAQAQHAAEAKEIRDAGNALPGLQPAAEIAEASQDQTMQTMPFNTSPAVISASDAPKPAPKVTPEDPEDSDEEVVVFVPNPKRMSAQKKAATSSSRPSTAQGQSPKPLTMQNSPRAAVQNIQNGPKAMEQDSSRVQIVPHGHPVPPISGPTVIDPDAFGRGFTVNTGPGTLAKVGTPRKSRQPSPRNSMQYASPNPDSGSTQDSPHTSPRRHKGRSPRPTPRALPQKLEHSPPTSVPVISHQAYTRAPLVAPNSQNAELVRDIKSHQAPIQRPRSANGPASGPSTRLNPLNGYAGSTRGGHQEQRLSRPSLFEPDLDRIGPQPDTDIRKTNMPEVQYTLKSGTTREAARGKGKLWVG